jgi:hypothetical protein
LVRTSLRILQVPAVELYGMATFIGRLTQTDEKAVVIRNSERGESLIQMITSPDAHLRTPPFSVSHSVEGSALNPKEISRSQLSRRACGDGGSRTGQAL